MSKWNLLTVQWRHNEYDGVSNHQPYDCLLNRLFIQRSKKTSKLRVTGLCAGNLSVTGEFPSQRASKAGKISIWWRHHEMDGARSAEFKMGYALFRKAFFIFWRPRFLTWPWLICVAKIVNVNIMIYHTYPHWGMFMTVQDVWELLTMSYENFSLTSWLIARKFKQHSNTCHKRLRIDHHTLNISFS